MFQSHASVAKRTTPNSLSRPEYLQSLVVEYTSLSETAQSERQKQEKQLPDLARRHEILARLANFAYDPFNYEWLIGLNVLDLFIDVISEEINPEPRPTYIKEKTPRLPDLVAVEFAMGGICNFMHYPPTRKALLNDTDAIQLFLKCLSLDQVEIVCGAMTILHTLVTASTSSSTSLDELALVQKLVLTQPVREYFVKLSKAKDVVDMRLKNLATVFLEDAFK